MNKSSQPRRKFIRESDLPPQEVWQKASAEFRANLGVARRDQVEAALHESNKLHKTTIATMAAHGVGAIEQADRGEDPADYRMVQFAMPIFMAAMSVPALYRCPHWRGVDRPMFLFADPPVFTCLSCLDREHQRLVDRAEPLYENECDRCGSQSETMRSMTIPYGLVRIHANICPACDQRRRELLPSASVGRRDPCPCGSGKRFKNCCGRWQP